jgi:YggT family protein
MRVDSETGLVIHRGVISRSPVALRLMQLVNFLFGVLYLLLATRFVLEYIQANRGSGFVQFIETVSNPFYAPFRRIVANGSDGAGHPIVWAIVIALVAYVILHAVIAQLLRMLARAPVDDIAP